MSDKPAKKDTENLTHNTLEALSWMSLGTGAKAFLQLLILFILARLLTPSDFGLLSTALTVVGFSETFSMLGIGPAIIQRPKLEESHLRTGFTVSLILGLSLMAIISFLSPSISGFFRMPDIEPVLIVISFAFPLRAVSIIAESLLARELRFRWISVAQVASYAFGYGAIGISMAWLGLGVWALVSAHLAQLALHGMLMLIAQPHPKHPQFQRGAFKELMYFGSGFTLARIGNYLGGQGDNIVIGRGLGAEMLGLYGRAYQLMAMPAMLFGQLLDRVLFSGMAKAQNELQRLAAAYRRGVALVALGVLPTSTFMLVLAPELIDLVLGPNWYGVIMPFQVFAVGMLFRTSYKIGDSLARATGAVYRRAWRQGIYAALVIGGAWIGQRWGLAGAAWGVVGAISVNFILMAQLSIRLTQMKWSAFWLAHLPALTSTLIAGIEVWSIASLLRARNAASIVIISVPLLATGATLLGLAYLFPKLMLGKDGLWMLQSTKKFISVAFAKEE
jgi:PST family polysaccharide transporter